MVEVRLPAGGCGLARATREDPDVDVQLIDAIHHEGGAFTEIFRFSGTGASRLFEKVSSLDAPQGARVIESGPSSLVCGLVRRCRCVRSALAAQGWFPLSVRLKGGSEFVSVAVGGREDGRRLLAFLKKRYEGFELVRVSPLSTLSAASKAPRPTALTPRQREILRAAVSSGYFEPARGASGLEIARSMGMDRGSFARQLRAALRNVVKSVAE